MAANIAPEREVLQEQRSKIMDSLTVNSRITDYLYSKRVLDPEECGNILCYESNSKRRPRDQVAQLLEILPSRGKHGFNMLLEALLQTGEVQAHEELSTMLRKERDAKVSALENQSGEAPKDTGRCCTEDERQPAIISEEVGRGVAGKSDMEEAREIRQLPVAAAGSGTRDPVPVQRIRVTTNY